MFKFLFFPFKFCFILHCVSKNILQKLKRLTTVEACFHLRIKKNVKLFSPFSKCRNSEADVAINLNQAKKSCRNSAFFSHYGEKWSLNCEIKSCNNVFILWQEKKHELREIKYIKIQRFFLQLRVYISQFLVYILQLCFCFHQGIKKAIATFYVLSLYFAILTFCCSCE